MRSYLAIGLVCVLACSKPAAPELDQARAPGKPAAATRWMWMIGMGGPFLSYYYVDRTEGPSAKGAHVSDPPTAAELDQVIHAPDHTFRDPVGMGARALTPDEITAAKLPPRPAWLDLFEPPGTPEARERRKPRTHGP